MEFEEYRKQESTSSQTNNINETSLFKIPVMLLSILIFLGCGIFFGWTYFEKTNMHGSSNLVKDNSELEYLDTRTEILNLNPFIVNLAGSSGERYLKVKMQLEVNKKLSEEFYDNPLCLPKIRDKILMILTTKTIDEVLDLKGKILLRKEIIVHLNELLKKGTVKNVYFTEFVVQ